MPQMTRLISALGALALTLTAVSAEAAPSRDEPSAAQTAAEKIIFEWGCTPISIGRQESFAPGRSASLPRDPLAPMAVALHFTCEPGHRAPGGGKAIITVQDASGSVSRSEPFDSISKVRLEADGTVTAIGRKAPFAPLETFRLRARQGWLSVIR